MEIQCDCKGQSEKKIYQFVCSSSNAFIQSIYRTHSFSSKKGIEFEQLTLVAFLACFFFDDLLPKNI